MTTATKQKEETAKKPSPFRGFAVQVIYGLIIGLILGFIARSFSCLLYTSDAADE